MEGKNQLSQQEVENHKRKHGVIFEVKVSGDAEKQQPDEYFYFKKPNMTTVSASVKLTETDPIQASILMFNDTLIHGRQAAIEDASVFLSIAKHLQKMVQVKQSEIKEL